MPPMRWRFQPTGALFIPMRVKGVVTAAETNWLGRFFVQDSSGGVFVVQPNKAGHLSPGDVVEVTAPLDPGGYAP